MWLSSLVILPLEEPMRVSDVMTPDPVAIGADRLIGDALEAFEAHGIRHLPVLDDGALLGVLSVRSVAPWRQAFLEAEIGHDLDLASVLLNTEVRAFIDREAIYVTPDTGIGEAIDQLLEFKIGAVPVLDAHGALVGIVSYVDLLRVMREMVED